MDLPLDALARFAAGIDPSAAPPAVRARLSLLHASAAGALRAVAPGARPETAAGLGAAASALGESCLEDTLFGGVPATAAVLGARAAGGAASADVLRGTLAGLELAGRLGLALLLAPEPALVAERTGALAAGVAWAVARGADAGAVGRVIAAALTAAGDAPPAVVGVRAAESALRGGGAGAVSAPGLGALGAGAVPLPVAFSGEGSAWVTLTLAFALSPVRPAARTTVEGVFEILRRHVKAADKRLRLDQLESITVLGSAGVVRGSVGASDARTPGAASLGAAVARVFASHTLDAGLWAGPVPEDVPALDARITVLHDPARSLATAFHRLEILAPLFSTVGAPALLRHAVARLLPLGAGDLRGVPRVVWAARLDRLHALHRDAPPDLGRAALEQLQHRGDVEVRLATTRGGVWPERRALPEGSPGWSWADTVGRVAARLPPGAPDPAAAPPADSAAWFAALDGRPH
jgi:hypothetical protein